jgi:hypothetical protein
MAILNPRRSDAEIEAPLRDGERYRLHDVLVDTALSSRGFRRQ